MAQLEISPQNVTGRIDGNSRAGVVLQVFSAPDKPLGPGPFPWGLRPPQKQMPSHRPHGLITQLFAVDEMPLSGTTGIYMYICNELGIIYKDSVSESYSNSNTVFRRRNPKALVPSVTSVQQEPSFPRQQYSSQGPAQVHAASSHQSTSQVYNCIS